MKSLLVVGPDSLLRDVHALAIQAYPNRNVEMLQIPSSDYYFFDLSGLQRFSPQHWDVCVAVNEFYINDVRRALFEAVEALGYQYQSVISPLAQVSSSAMLGRNAVVYSGCVVGAEAKLGECCVLRANVVLSEDVTLGNYVTLEANVAVREFSSIGDFTTICANSSLARMTSVGRHCYLNIQRQYSGVVPDKAFYSPSFEQPVRVLSPS